MESPVKQRLIEFIKYKNLSQKRFHESKQTYIQLCSHNEETYR